jgi:nucleoside-diphosphate-sugar epimerase
MKVAVFGASGFVGATLIEHLVGCPKVETQAFIHSYGSAWRLARAAIPLRTVDITSSKEVNTVLADCTHVVNCTRGDSPVMLLGLKNLLTASKDRGVKRFVHLSSVAVYGDPPPIASEHESAPTKPEPGSYGEEKLKQDDMVKEACSAGLDSVVLCPPNISGVYSSFVCNVLDDIRHDTFSLVDGGERPLNIVDVDNLAYAIIRALQVSKGDGRRIFVSDGDNISWKDLALALQPLRETILPVANIATGALASAPMSSKRPSSLWRSAKHLVSSDVREALRKDPLLAKADSGLRRLASLAGRGFEDRLRHSIEGPITVDKVYDTNPHSSRYNVMQLRGVTHRTDRAREVLGYAPPLSFHESMTRFCLWYSAMHGFGAGYWPLAALLAEF